MDEILGFGRFGSNNNRDGVITFSGTLASERAPRPPFPFPQPPKPTGSFVLALLGLSIVDQGFEQLHFQVQVDGTTAIDLTFTDALAAVAYFDDNILTFGSASGLLPDLDVFFDITSSDTSFAMELELILGTVPEPGTVVLLMLVVGWRSWRFRRRR